MKLPETVAEVENLTQRFLEHHGFPQCIGAIDGTHIPIRQPNQNYADYITVTERGLHPSMLKPFAITVVAFWM